MIKVDRRTWAEVDPEDQRNGRNEGRAQFKTPRNSTSPLKSKIGRKSEENAERSLIVNVEHDEQL